jgi:pimeloyl-ACP methyl ester carboxylesterase
MPNGGVSLLIVALLLSGQPGGTPAAAHSPTRPLGLPPGLEIPWPTLGGKQFWTDEWFFHQWRIQRNSVTGQYRLLDPNHLQYAAGSYVECRAKLEEVKRTRNLPPMKGKAVIVLHGLFRSRASMGKLCKYLEEQGGYVVVNISYASTQNDVAGHARALERVVRSLEGIEEISFVGHSMGNIVVRSFLHERARGVDGRPADRRIKRFVMLAPPNHGSLVAVALAENGLFQVVTGKAGQELGREWEKLQGKLATPAIEFGILAGGLENGRGFNPLLPGDNDGTVTVAGTRLAGASDFRVLPVMHTFIMSDAKTLQYTLQFLQKGYFVSPETRTPITEDGAGEAEKKAE